MCIAAGRSPPNSVYSLFFIVYHLSLSFHESPKFSCRYSTVYIIFISLLTLCSVILTFIGIHVVMKVILSLLSKSLKVCEWMHGLHDLLLHRVKEVLALLICKAAGTKIHKIHSFLPGRRWHFCCRYAFSFSPEEQMTAAFSNLLMPLYLYCTSLLSKHNFHAY